LLAAFVTLLSVSSPAHAAFALPALPFQVSLLLPLSFGVIVAIDRLRKRISFKRDLVWLVALAMAVGLLAYSGEIRDGKVGFLMILVCIVLVMFALGYLVARLIALAVRRQDS
jgi:hypothetical protein